MEKQLEEKNTEMGNVITRSEEFIQKNQKALISVLVVILVLIVAFFAARKWYFQPREMRAADEMFAAEQWFQQGDYEKALNGDDTFSGFLGIIDSYGSTKAGNLAKYYAGSAYLHMGDYDEAARWLKKYSGKDTFTPALAEMMRADALAEHEDFAAAAKLYKNAAAMDDNFLTAPAALFKAGLAYLGAGDNQNALASFKKVKSDYPQSAEYRDIDRYITLAEAAN